MAYLARELRTSSVFMDVGANLGYFTVLCAPLVSRVIAFEPVAKTASYCEANLALNHLANVDLRRIGLWHENATVHINTDSSSVMTASLAPTSAVSGGESIEVVSLDTLCATGGLDLDRLDVIKMDAEGAELSALIGMRAPLERLHPQVVMEINRPALASLGATVDEIWDLLQGLSYDIHAFEHWTEQAPEPVATLDGLKQRCPEDALIDIVASRRPVGASV